MTDCCGFHRAMSRRGLIGALGLGAAGALAGLTAPRIVRAAEVHAAPTRVAPLAVTAAPAPAHGTEVLLLTCMDFRLQNETVNYMDRRGLRDKYDHIVLAGASIGVLAEQRPEWGMVFWDHLDTAIKLHKVHKVMVIDHLDCGAYKLFLGEAAVKDPVAEVTAHAQRLRLLRSAINQQNADLEVELGVMALDGTVQTVS